MKCPKCEHKKTSVLDSRDAPKYRYRRRKCLKCKHHFTTHERIVKGEDGDAELRRLHKEAKFHLSRLISKLREQDMRYKYDE